MVGFVSVGSEIGVWSDPLRSLVMMVVVVMESDENVIQLFFDCFRIGTLSDLHHHSRVVSGSAGECCLFIHCTPLEIICGMQ